MKSELLLFYVLFLEVVSSFPSTGDLSDALGLKEDDVDELIQLKLIPYHVQRRRRLEESGMAEGIDLSMRNVDRPHRYARRRIQQEGEPKQVAELFQGYGTHYVDLWIGTPLPQRQTVIVDTGSGVTAFPCAGCENCGVPNYHASALFDYTQSRTFEKLNCQQCVRGRCTGDDQCSITMSYQEGSSWTAFEGQDLSYVGGLHSASVTTTALTVEDDLNPFLAEKFAFNLKFGCQTHLTGLFITQLADGIMGLDNAVASFNQQMFEADKIPNKGFSLCYARQDHVDTKGTESGAFTLGGSDARVHRTPMVFAKTFSGGGFFGVKVRNMYLREGNSGDSATSTNPTATVTSLGFSDADFQVGQVIVDSGTTDTYFPRSIGYKFETLFEQIAGIKYTHSKKTMTIAQVNALPTILIQLVGDDSNQAIASQSGTPVTGLAGDLDKDNPFDVILAIPPTHYMEYDSDEKNWVNRFYTDEPSGGVIGGNAMMGHDVFFDVDNSRIGWSEADCNYTALVEQYSFTGEQQNIVDDPNREEIPNPTPKTPATAPSSSSGNDDTTTDSEDSVYSGELAGGKFCSSITCQGAVVAGIFVVVAVVAMVVFGRSRRGPSYTLNETLDVTELELQDARGMTLSDGNEDGVRYRDDLVDEESFEDEPKVTRV